MNPGFFFSSTGSDVQTLWKSGKIHLHVSCLRSALPVLPNQLYQVLGVCWRKAGKTYGRKAPNQAKQRNMHRSSDCNIKTREQDELDFIFLNQFYTEAPFRRSDGSTRHRSQRQQDQRQPGDTWEQSPTPEGADGFHHQAAGVPQGKSEVHPLLDRLRCITKHQDKDQLGKNFRWLTASNVFSFYQGRRKSSEYE